MDASARFSRCIFQWERLLLQFAGQDFTVENFRPNLISYSVYGLASTTYVAEIYTFMNYDSIKKIYALLCILTGTQVCTLILLPLHSHKSNSEFMTCYLVIRVCRRCAMRFMPMIFIGRLTSFRTCIIFMRKPNHVKLLHILKNSLFSPRFCSKP